MRLSDFKIGARLTAAFGPVVMLSIASAGLAVAKLSVIEAHLDDVVNDNNVKIRLNKDMAEAGHVVARVTRTVALLEDKEEMGLELTRITHAREGYNQRWEALQEFPASEIEKAKRASIEQDMRVARPLNNRVIELMQADEDAEAVALLLNEAQQQPTG